MTLFGESSYSDETDLRWQDYEELVKDIYETLGKTTGVTIECWGSSCKVEGPPGSFHQIDVLTSHDDGLHRYLTAISCKYWNKRVDVPVVREFAQIIQDAQLNRGVIVSKMGFTGPAKNYAQSKGIGLVELRKPVDRDWDGLIKVIHLNLIIDQTEIYDVQFDLIAPKDRHNQQDFQGGPVDWPLLLSQVLIEIPDQHAVTLQSLIDEERRKCPDQEQFHLQFDKGSIVTVPDFPDYPANGYDIRGVSFKVKYSPPLTKEVVINAEDHIYMFMESIFEGRRFTITKSGEIVEKSLR